MFVQSHWFTIPKHLFLCVRFFKNVYHHIDSRIERTTNTEK
ncbi:hypothetical protein F0Z19_3052 [Vibrio cyclitrophicus]|nr:hypothetical protein F0Z19_3052 [Vibrio cyclitrophicus]